MTPFTHSRVWFSIVLIIYLLPITSAIHELLINNSVNVANDISCSMVTEVEYLSQPLGLDTLKPRFAWFAKDSCLTSFPRNLIQKSYQIQISCNKSDIGSSKTSRNSNAYFGESPVIISSQSSQVEMDVELSPGGHYWWSVKVVYASDDGHEVPMSWSSPSRFSISPSPSSFSQSSMRSAYVPAKFVTSSSFPSSTCLWYRRQFNTAQWPDVTPWTPATPLLLHIASYGFYELYINGNKVSEDVLTPSVSNLNSRLMVKTFDISPLVLVDQDNMLGVWVAPGWIMYSLYNQTSLKTPAFMISIDVPIATGGSVSVFHSDESFQVTASDREYLGTWNQHNYGGERITTARSDPTNKWSSIAPSSLQWLPAVTTTSLDHLLLTPDLVEGNQVRDAIPSNQITIMENNANDGTVSVMVEMTEVFTGWLSFSLSGFANTTATIDISSGIICNTVPAKNRPYCVPSPEYGQTHQLVFSNSGKYTFLNKFSYQEIHYVVIKGITSAPEITDITGFRVGNIAILKDVMSSERGDDTGRRLLSDFTTGDSRLNQIYSTSLNTVSNLVLGGMSVDCPHRERLGYLGDAHTTIETAMQTLSSGAFYTKWSKDILDVQNTGYHVPLQVSSTGYIPNSAPTLEGGGGPAWSGFIIVMPWTLYETYGDTRLLALSYPSQLSLVKFWNQQTNSTTGLMYDFGDSNFPYVFLADWLSPHGCEMSDSIEAILFNNAYIIYATRLTAKIARVLKDDSRAVTLETLANQRAAALHTIFFRSDMYLDSRQTHLVMPIISGSVPSTLLPGVWNTLLKEILITQARHIDTGLSGTYFMVKFLSDTSQAGWGDRDDLIHAMVTEQSFPGYMDLLSQGYSTWPEAWGSCADSSSAPIYQCAPSKWSTGSDSVIHGCLNGIGLWFISGVAGIRRQQGSTGYSIIDLRPAWGVGGLLSASASFVSPRGRISSSWSLLLSNASDISVNVFVSYNVSVPANIRASVYLPAISLNNIQENGKSIAAVSGSHWRSCHVGITGISTSDCHGAVLSYQATAAMFIINVGSGTYHFTSEYVHVILKT